jgi:protein-S-isoprenylcysteine O-methyltransferase Ste14
VTTATAARQSEQRESEVYLVGHAATARCVALPSTLDIFKNMVLLAFFVVYFMLTFAMRAALVYRRTGINPLVLPARDDAYGYVGRAFKIVIASVAVFVCIEAFAPATLQGLGRIKLFRGEMLAATGWSLMIVSLAWLLVAQSQMGNSWRVGIDEKRKTELVTHGLFAISRNPIFLGMRVTLAGLFLATPSAITLAIAVAGELLMQVQVRLEEAHLSNLHGERYAQYGQQVRRWL